MGIRVIDNPFGFLPAGAPNSSTFALNAANARHAMSFIAPPTTKTLTQAACILFSMTGSVSAAEFKAELQADSAGAPSNSALETVNCDATPVGSITAVNTHTFSTSLTAGARYWIVYKNTNATPASNFVTFVWGNTASADCGAVTSANFHWARKVSADASTWDTGQAEVVGLRVKFNDGSYDGFPFSGGGNTVVGDGVYGSRELGDIFTTPDIKLHVVGIRMMLAVKTGTPTGTLRFKLYQGTTLLGTTADLYTTSPVVGMYVEGFSSPIVLLPNTAHRITIAESTQSDASTNRYNARVYGLMQDAASKTMMPFGGTMMKTYFDGSIWTNTDTDLIPGSVILDPDVPFSPTEDIVIPMPGA